MKLITNENKVSGLHYCMHIKLHLLMWYYSGSVLFQSCKVYILTFFYLTVKCNSLQITEIQRDFAMKHGGHYSSKKTICTFVEN